ncbi:hypothetical protein PDJAM_G00093780 [Pangasius djambal]|uniref:Uncharacterized protein n=1 Tax=Pangasius djambal TaxID=1691987 RepID=A0ACC5Z6C1_9TELE|nr:hypothetical protein [Pangasius djambal]
MTLQWTAVALFLYVEIGILILLCLPFISAQRWQIIFNLNIWNHVAWLWKRGFLAMIIILIVLFLDAVREVRKYSGAQISKDSKTYPNMFDHVHMKLFRSQRNLYISGFALLLWLVMQRVIKLINQLAAAANTNSALHVQIEDANQSAKKYMEEIEQLKQALVAHSKQTVTDIKMVVAHIGCAAHSTEYALQHDASHEGFHCAIV